VGNLKTRGALQFPQIRREEMHGQRGGFGKSGRGNKLGSQGRREGKLTMQKKTAGIEELSLQKKTG